MLFIRAVQPLNSNVFKVALQGVFSERHNPGQYLELYNGEQWLPYSIANVISGDGVAEFHIKRTGGTSTELLFNILMKESYIEASEPKGECKWLPGDASPLILISAGTGFAQMKSIIDAVLSFDQERPVHLWWAGKKREDLYMERSMSALSKIYNNFKFFPVVEESTDKLFGGANQRLDDALREGIESIPGADAFVAGSPSMVSNIKSVLENFPFFDGGFFSDMIIKKKC